MPYGVSHTQHENGTTVREKEEKYNLFVFWYYGILSLDACFDPWSLHAVLISYVASRN